MQKSVRNVFETLEKILLRCWIFGAVLLILWFIAALSMGNTIHKFHGPMFGITRHELDVIFYVMMGLLKLIVSVFFFIPWLSIRLVLNKTKAVDAPTL